MAPAQPTKNKDEILKDLINLMESEGFECKIVEIPNKISIWQKIKSFF